MRVSVWESTLAEAKGRAEGEELRGAELTSQTWRKSDKMEHGETVCRWG